MFLGIDIGTSSVKMILTDGKEEVKASASYNVVPQGLEQPPEILETAVKESFQKITAKDSRASSVEAVGVCGHGPSILILDKKGKPLTGIVDWQDKRGSAEAAWLRENVPDFYKDGSSYEAKILWYYRNKPELFYPGNKVVYPKDYILYRLTGRKVIDRSAASTSCFYNPETGCWDNPAGGITSELFPEIVDSSEIIGTAGTEFSREMGLPDGTGVCAGGIDAFCEALGAGGTKPGTLIDGTGTSTCLTLCRKLATGRDLHVISGMELLIKPLSCTGGSVKWWREIIGREEIFSGINPEEPVNILFLPYLIGERSPIWDEKASGVFLGLNRQTTADDMLKAVLQGTSYAVRQNLEVIMSEESTGEHVHAVGGGAVNEKWLRIKADATGKIYRKMKNPDGAALGAAVLAAAGHTGAKAGEIGSLWAYPEKDFYPDEKIRQIHEGLYDVYKSMYPALKDSYARMEENRKSRLQKEAE